MAKTKSAFFCQQCGHETPKWTGKCSSCGGWNTYVEEVIQRDEKSAEKEKFVWEAQGKEAKQAQRMDAVIVSDMPRILLQDAELNRTLGGGLVPGSVVLVAGEPGIGKSTLFLQMALQWQHGLALYVS
ncbi:MAG: AAA family ATPase, partial [Chitinophagaceae bacterium]|nr:AAA family ATPase [Chitinophagaceae bacterium]